MSLKIQINGFKRVSYKSIGYWVSRFRNWEYKWVWNYKQMNLKSELESNRLLSIKVRIWKYKWGMYVSSWSIFLFFLFFILFYGYFGILWTHGSVCFVLHWEISLTWCETSKFHGISEHFSEWNISPHAEHVAFGLSFGDWSFPLHDTGHDGWIDILAAVDFYIHEWF